MDLLFSYNQQVDVKREILTPSYHHDLHKSSFIIFQHLFSWARRKALVYLKRDRCIFSSAVQELPACQLREKPHKPQCSRYVARLSARTFWGEKRVCQH